MDQQRLDLSEIEIPHIVAAIVPAPVREAFGHVGDAIEVDVMQDDELVVPGCDDILLEIVRAHGETKRLGLQRVLRQVARRPSMRDDGK